MQQIQYLPFAHERTANALGGGQEETDAEMKAHYSSAFAYTAAYCCSLRQTLTTYLNPSNDRPSKHTHTPASLDSAHAHARTHIESLDALRALERRTRNKRDQRMERERREEREEDGCKARLGERRPFLSCFSSCFLCAF